MKVKYIILTILICFTAKAKPISIPIQSEVRDTLMKRAKVNSKSKERAIWAVASYADYVKNSDMTDEQFKKYCLENFISDDNEFKNFIAEFAKYYEYISGHYNQLNLELNYRTQLDSGSTTKFDNMFSNYDPYSNLGQDLKKLGIADLIALNCPKFTLKEKNRVGLDWDNFQWAVARAGDMFSNEPTADIYSSINKARSDAGNYIANYYIYAGNLVDNNGKKYFPSDLKLISHWNLRDEIKSSYAKDNSKQRQDLIYNVMLRIIEQSIPQNVINNNKYTWNPLKNELYDGNKIISSEKENYTRYEQILNNYNALKLADKFYGNTYIERKFNNEYEIELKTIEKLFHDFLSSKVKYDVANIIKKKLNRNLDAYDIWYDGFKARGSINEQYLDSITKSKFRTTANFQKYLDTILLKLGFDSTQTKFLSSNVIVDASRGAGHASGSESKQFKARLRTRFTSDGMDYKGYNIAVHEFGHNVEQTYSLHNTSNYLLRGVPNNAFTEAIAFTFQTKDLDILGIKNSSQEAKLNYILDNYWSTFEIMGVATVDQRVWKWLYENPNADKKSLCENTIRIAKEVWNEYYADVIGVKDSPILAVYSHMIDYPLYLTAYPLGHLIEFQLESHYKGKDFAKETKRVSSIGKLTPKLWMLKAVGWEISSESLLSETSKAVKELGK
jgi:hypothetical protein